VGAAAAVAACALKSALLAFQVVVFDSAMGRPLASVAK